MIQVGVDYYPEQWNPGIWERDAQRMEDIGVRVVRIGEFAWSRMEPRDGQFDFAWLDEAMTTLADHRMQIILGTPTNCAPMWLYQEHPDTLQCDMDGKTTDTGIRGHRCIMSPTFREYAGRIVEQMAQRYAKKPEVFAWQIDNELESNRCTCPTCRDAFRAWVKDKYESLDALNDAWGTEVWSGEISDWTQIQPPRADRKPDWYNPAYMLDYARFAAECVKDFVQFQCAIIRSFNPDARITTNAFFPEHMPDFHQEFIPLTVASYDNYPPVVLPEDPEEPYSSAFALDFVRGFKQQNFWITEQLGGPMGCWSPISPAMEPGMLEGYALQAVAHGADLISFFRWRTAASGAEMFCHGLLDHNNMPNRRLHELENLCHRLEELPALSDTTVHSEVAMLYSADTDFALKNQTQGANFSYWNQMRLLHDACMSLAVNVDVIEQHSRLDTYKVVLVPSYFVTDRDVVGALEAFVEAGGTVMVTCRSGVVDKNGNCITSQPLPTLLQELCECEVTEYDAIGHAVQQIQMDNGETYRITGWCDLLKSNGAQVIARYKGRFYDGIAAITKHQFGKGDAYYVGTVGDRAMYRALLAKMFAGQRVAHAFLPQGVEGTTRTGKGGSYAFYFNNTTQSQHFDLAGQSVQMRPFEMKIWTESGERM